MRFAQLIFSAALFTSISLHASAMSRGTPGYTLIVIPDSPAVVQISNDLGSRYPVLLVAYDTTGNPSTPFLNVLHNNQWIRVPNDQFISGSFLQQRPRRTIVVGDDNPMTEALLVRVAAWSAQVINHPASNPTFLLNMYGRDFNFTKSDWRWFAKKYDLDLKDANRDRAQNWYTQPYVDETRAASQTNLQAPALSTPPAPPREQFIVPSPEPAPALQENLPPPTLTPSDAPATPANPAFQGWQAP